MGLDSAMINKRAHQCGGDYTCTTCGRIWPCAVWRNSSVTIMEALGRAFRGVPAVAR